MGWVRVEGERARLRVNADAVFVETGMQYLTMLDYLYRYQTKFTFIIISLRLSHTKVSHHRFYTA